MKKLLFLLPLLIVSCKKDLPESASTLNSDSVITQNSADKEMSADSLRIKDSLISNSPAVEKVLEEGINRKLKENNIVRTADGVMLPFTIGDEITEEGQKFILTVKNVSQAQLKISVGSKEPMNIRINQIQNPDGSMDGPFGRSYIYKTPQKGDYRIILGRSLMADGEGKGHFTIKVE